MVDQTRNKTVNERAQVISRAVRNLQRIRLLATLIGGAVVVVGVVLITVSLSRGQLDDIPVAAMFISVGFVFAIGARIATRSFMHAVVKTFVPLDDPMPEDLKRELESLNVPPEILNQSTTANSPAHREPQQPPRVVDFFATDDGAINVLFHWGEHSFHVLFGNATAKSTGDQNEPWRVQLGVRRRDETEVDYGMLDDLIQCSPYLRFRFEGSDRVREPDEWFGGDPCIIADKPGEMDLAMYFDDPPQTMELIWIDGVARSLGKLPVKRN